MCADFNAYDAALIFWIMDAILASIYLWQLHLGKVLGSWEHMVQMDRFNLKDVSHGNSQIWRKKMDEITLNSFCGLFLFRFSPYLALAALFSDGLEVINNLEGPWFVWSAFLIGFSISVVGDAVAKTVRGVTLGDDFSEDSRWYEPVTGGEGYRERCSLLGMRGAIK